MALSDLDWDGLIKPGARTAFAGNADRFGTQPDAAPAPSPAPVAAVKAQSPYASMSDIGQSVGQSMSAFGAGFMGKADPSGGYAETPTSPSLIPYTKKVPASDVGLSPNQGYVDAGRNVRAALDSGDAYVANLFKPSEKLGGIAPLSLLKSGAALFTTGDVSAGEKALSESEANLAAPAQRAQALKRGAGEIEQIGATTKDIQTGTVSKGLDIQAKRAALPYAGPAARAGVASTEAGTAQTIAQTGNIKNQFPHEIRKLGLEQFNELARIGARGQIDKAVAEIHNQPAYQENLARIEGVYATPTKSKSGRPSNLAAELRFYDFSAADQPSFESAYSVAQPIISQDAGLDSSIAVQARSSIQAEQLAALTATGEQLTADQAFKRAYVKIAQRMSPVLSRGASPGGQPKPPPAAPMPPRG